jgi:hypothetical protein
VQDGDAVAEALLEARREHRRERDLRHEQDGLLSPLHDASHQLDVHLGLAAAGHPFQEERGEGAERLAHGLDGQALLERVGDLPCRGPFQSGQEGVQRVPARAALDAHDVLLRQRGEHGRADAAMLERAHGQLAAAGLQQLDGGLLLGRESAGIALQHDEAVVAHAHRVLEAIVQGDDPRVAEPRDGGARDLQLLEDRRHRQRAFAQFVEEDQVGVEDLLLLAGPLDRGVVGHEHGLPLPARGHVRRQGHAEHLAEGGEVVLRGPAAEVDDLGDERRLFVVEHGADRLQLLVGGRGVEQGHDEAGDELRAEGDLDPRAEADAVAQRLGDGVRERLVQCDRDGDFGVLGDPRHG